MANGSVVQRLEGNDKVLVLDGGFGSLLEELGYRTDLSPFWSGGANTERPDLVQKCHELFIEAGADIIETNTYHCSIQKMKEVMGISHEGAEDLIIEVVGIAKKAILESNKPNTLLVGSIGPYATYLRDGSEYTAAYTKKDDFNPRIIYDYYTDQVKLLIKAGVRVLVFETIPSLCEVECVGKVLDRLEPGTYDEAWIVVTCQDGERIRSGDSFQSVVRLACSFPTVSCIGINCTSPVHITSLLRNASKVNVTKEGESKKKHLVVYPNTGEVWNPVNNKFEGDTCIGHITQLIPEWKQMGVRIFGGCCRVLPEHIQQIAEKCDELNKTSNDAP